MVKQGDVYVIGKGREWLQAVRPDIRQMPTGRLWGQYLFSAKRYENLREAKKKARSVGGTVYRFDPLNGKTEPVSGMIPQGADCDGCRWWNGWDGICRNGKSENYRVPMSMRDVCGEWEGKNGR